MHLDKSFLCSLIDFSLISYWGSVSMSRAQDSRPLAALSAFCIFCTLVYASLTKVHLSPTTWPWILLLWSTYLLMPNNVCISKSLHKCQWLLLIHIHDVKLQINCAILSFKIGNWIVHITHHPLHFVFPTYSEVKKWCFDGWASRSFSIHQSDPQRIDVTTCKWLIQLRSYRPQLVK